MSTIEQQVILDLQRRVRDLERVVASLARVESAGGAPIAADNVSNPPTDAQLDTAFGTAANISGGMFKLVDDAGLSSAVWGAVPIGSFWWYWQLTKAA
jgi:hypothetical protein